MFSNLIQFIALMWGLFWDGVSKAFLPIAAGFVFFLSSLSDVMALSVGEDAIELPPPAVVEGVIPSESFKFISSSSEGALSIEARTRRFLE